MHQQRSILNLYPRFRLMRTNAVTSSVFIRVTMGMGAFIHSSKANSREVLLGSTSFILFSILFVHSGSADCRLSGRRWVLFRLTVRNFRYIV